MSFENTKKAATVMSWRDVMALRSAYNNGLRTAETREACRIYIAEMRKRKSSNGGTK